MYKNGGTHILVPSHMVMNRSQVPWRCIRRIDHPYAASRYECLSPVYFENTEKLWTKLNTYIVKPKKKSKQMNNRAESDLPMENNDANKSFTAGGDGRDRIEFEHNR
jgi:hypothetical protein